MEPFPDDNAFGGSASDAATAEALRVARALGSAIASDARALTVVAPNMQVHVHLGSGTSIPPIEHSQIGHHVEGPDLADDDLPPADYSTV